MRAFKWFLQLFADGAGDGGSTGAEGTAQGVTSPAPEDVDSASNLGIPEKYRRIQEKAQAKGLANVAVANADGTENTATDTTAENKPNQEQRKGLKDLVKDDPTLNEELQGIIRERLRKSKGAESALNALMPVIDALGAKYSIDTSDLAKMDIGALVNAMNADDSYYEDKAEEMGVSVENARALAEAENSRKRQQAQQQADFIEQKRQEFNTNLVNQANAFRQAHPEFNLSESWLDNEIQNNPQFARMLAPGVNLPIETAYYATHRDEIQRMQSQVVASGVRREVANAVAANRSRPSEAGTKGQASSVSRFDYSKMTDAQRKDFLDYAKRASARGEKVYIK